MLGGGLVNRNRKEKQGKMGKKNPEDFKKKRASF